mmetsp:Transcript_14882/g.33452  ORF Transcript_14882/g.33452 Transcript_14882/m.33452 type:complete len:214 (-) Transcript_14882:474-1115(-)
MDEPCFCLLLTIICVASWMRCARLCLFARVSRRAGRLYPLVFLLCALRAALIAPRSISTGSSRACALPSCPASLKMRPSCSSTSSASSPLLSALRTARRALSNLPWRSRLWLSCSQFCATRDRWSRIPRMLRRTASRADRCDTEGAMTESRWDHCSTAAAKAGGTSSIPVMPVTATALMPTMVVVGGGTASSWYPVSSSCRVCRRVSSGYVRS